MSRDPLFEATRALRESAEAPKARADETRARVMATLRKERARRIPLLRAAIPLAAVLVGSMAWAAAGGLLPTSIRAVLPGFSAAAEAPSSPRDLPSSAPSTEAAAPPEAAAQPLEAPPAEDSVSAPQGALPQGAAKPIGTLTPPPFAAPKSILPRSTPGQIAAPPRAASTMAPTVVTPAPTPAPLVEPDEQALYTAAHRLHFVEHNPGAALSAWDTYLRAAPRGRLSVEAHYNRALCLVRLGRAAEAEAALDSFARGAYGGYRQAEAKALLEALRGAAP